VIQGTASTDPGLKAGACEEQVHIDQGQFGRVSLAEMAITGTDLRTLVYTPTGKDGRLIAAFLEERQDMECQVASCVEQVCASIRMGGGAALFSEEAFAGNSLEPLMETLRCQPSWSDFAVILLTVSGRVTVESERLRELRAGRWATCFCWSGRFGPRRC
jgi:hypothetical protein